MRDFAKFAGELVQGQALLRAGVELGQEVERMKLDAIIHAYDLALQNPKTVIPTPLHAAIEAARK